jgi:hypothetical protein
MVAISHIPPPPPIYQKEDIQVGLLAAIYDAGKG